jgi:nucleoid-associated protein YgaU
MESSPERLRKKGDCMGLRDTYAYAIQTAKGKFNGSAEERDGKLYFKGTIATEEQKNELWNAIKTIPSWRNDVVADIQVVGGPAPAAAATAPKTYTVQSGDTLSQIAKRELGNAGAYMKIFELNKDQLSDPDKIKVGQVLRLP